MRRAGSVRIIRHRRRGELELRGALGGCVVSRRRQEERAFAGAEAGTGTLAGAGEADLTVYAAVTELLATSGEVDAVLLSGYLGCYGEDSPDILDAELGNGWR